MINSNNDLWDYECKRLENGRTEIDTGPLFKGEALVNQDIFFHFPIYLQSYKESNNDRRNLLFRTRPGSVVILGDGKPHEYLEDGGPELYNLEDDLGEKNILVKNHPEKAQKLHRKLVAWRIQMQACYSIEKNPEYDFLFEKQALDKANQM